MATGRDTEVGARSRPRGRKARGSAPTALTAPHPARSELLRQAGQRVFNSVGPSARLSRSTGSRILRGGHHGGLNSRRRPAFPRKALTDAYRSEGSSLPSGGQQTTLATLLSVPRKAFPLSLLVMRTLDHLCRECKKFWALSIVGTGMIVKGWMNVVSHASRRRHEKRGQRRATQRPRSPSPCGRMTRWK